MPKLPDDLGPRPTPNYQGQVVPISSGGTAGMARARLGDTLSGIGDQLQGVQDRTQQRQDKLSYARAKSSLLQEQITAISELENDPDYSTHETRYQERMKKAKDSSLKLLNNGYDREAFMIDSDADVLRGLESVKSKAWQRETDTAISSVEKMRQDNREAAIRAPDVTTRMNLIKSTQDAIDGLAVRGYIPQTKAVTMRQSAAEDYATASIDSLPYGQQIKALKDKGVADFIPSDKRADMLRRAEQQLKQEQALNRAAISDRVQDATAAYLSGLKYDNPPSQQEMVSAYGEKEGQQRYASLQKTQKLGADISYAALATPEELATLLAGADPRKAVVGAGFAEDSQRFGMLVNSVSAMQKEKQADPVSYLQKYDPKFKALWESLGQSGNYAEYARTMTAEQQRLGVQDVKLLPEKYAQTVVSEFNKLAEGGENSADMIEQLAGQWGKQWPTVYKQLSKDLPPSALVIASGVDRPTAEILARTAPLKTEELRAGIPKDKVSKLPGELSTQFAEFQRTLLQQAGGEKTFSTIYDQAQRLALTYMGRGDDETTAVEKAYASLVSDKYVIKDTYRIPTQYNADAISDAAEQLLRPDNSLENSFEIGKVGILPNQAARESAPELNLDGIDVLPEPGVSKEFLQKRAKSALQRNGYWVTNGDETGLVLYSNDLRGRPSAVTRNGNVIEVSFDELAGMQ